MYRAKYFSPCTPYSGERGSSGIRRRRAGMRRAAMLNSLSSIDRVLKLVAISLTCILAFSITDLGLWRRCTGTRCVGTRNLHLNCVSSEKKAGFRIQTLLCRANKGSSRSLGRARDSKAQSPRGGRTYIFRSPWPVDSGTKSIVRKVQHILHLWLAPQGVATRADCSVLRSVLRATDYGESTLQIRRALSQCSH